MPRKALPGHSAQDKHPPVKMFEPIKNGTLSTWSPR